MTSSPAHDPDRIARSWVAHLRAGGRTPWSQWEYDDEPGEPTRQGPVPGAAPLEVVRRLAMHRCASDLVDTGDFTALADVVLARSGPGRGMGEIPLPHKGIEQATAVGTPPTDPADVPVEELLRVCVGALAELLVTTPPDPEPVTSPTRRRRPWATSFRLVGAPASRASVRAVLAANRHVEGGRRPTVLVLADPLEEMLGQVWSARVQRGATVRWPRLLANLVRADRLPPAVDLTQVAARWADRVGADRVHVLLPDGGPAARQAAGLLGLRLREATFDDRGALPEPRWLPEPLRLSAPETEVLRRVNAVLSVRVPAARHHALVRRAARLLRESPGAAVPPAAVPPDVAAWVRARAEQMHDQLLAGGYAVHGDPERLAAGGGAPLRRSAVLDVALAACLRVAHDNRSQEVPGS